MDVANQFEQVGVLLANEGFVPTLKEISRALVPQIEVEGIACQQTAHERGQPCRSRSHQEVKSVVVEQRSGEAFGSGLDEKFREFSEESASVGVIAEDGTATHTSHDHMLEQIGKVNACGSWQGGKIEAGGELVNEENVPLGFPDQGAKGRLRKNVVAPGSLSTHTCPPWA